MTRRKFLSFIATSPVLFAAEGAHASGFEITRTEKEWKAMLSDAEYYVMREEGTERARTSPLDKEYSEGRYDCRGCDLPLFDSETKFDSGTGWPSFYAPIENAVETREDRKLFMKRTEVHCRRCGSHLGHVFNDGPRANGYALLHERRELEVYPSLIALISSPIGVPV